MERKRVLALSLGPIFKDHVHGGSQKIFREVISHLGRKGHQVSVYCVRRDDNHTSFQLGENVTVNPCLRFKQTFPQAYFTAPYNLEQIISVIEKEKKNHDVIYAHDSGFNFPSLYDGIPTVSSLRDFLYPETLVGAFSFERDSLIVNSQYTLDSFLQTNCSLRPQIGERVEYIPNGIDLEHFRKRTNLDRIKQIIHLDPTDIPILYPHRPEESKGIFDTLKVIALLKEKGLENVKLLIPEYINFSVSQEHSPTYSKMKALAKELSIEKDIIFHNWVSYELMPEYYSLGALTLSLGNFVESFPNTSVESVACETPSISSQVAAHRTVLPEDIEHRVDFGDFEEAANIAYEILKGNGVDTKKGREFIQQTYRYVDMLKGYERVIQNCSILPPLKTQINNSPLTHMKIPSWCHLSKRFGLYNDYKYSYVDDRRLLDILSQEVEVPISAENKKLLHYHLDEGNVIGIRK